jgi:hypothetical protein
MIVTVREQLKFHFPFCGNVFKVLVSTWKISYRWLFFQLTLNPGHLTLRHLRFLRQNKSHKLNSVVFLSATWTGWMERVRRPDPIYPELNNKNTHKSWHIQVNNVRQPTEATVNF